jgi:hypothetical protein
MDAKFLTLTGVLSAAAFGAVWFLATPASSDMVAAPDRDIAILAQKPHPRFVVEAPPQDMQPDSTDAEEAGPSPRTGSVAALSVYYPDCRAAWAAGVAPIYKGQPGYRPEMDGDGDGIACEPVRNR